MKKDNSIFKFKIYKHIDKPFNAKKIFEDIQNADYIIKHGFYPFLSSLIVFEKFNGEKKRKIKERPIKYASHVDRYIYQYYSSLLNVKYNEYCASNNFDECSVAYRTCLSGQTNIEFASRVFKKIKTCGSCYVLVSDFTDFFDTIEHKILKENICMILGVDCLSEDWYKVYKSMTKYTYVSKEEIISYLKDNKIETDESISKLKSYFENIPWNIAKKDLNIKKNKECYGIPQGSPLSGVFANIFMIEFDNKLNQYAKSKSGLYMRYSDDMILVIPKDKVDSVDEIWAYVSGVKEDYNYLKINSDKTSAYLYENKKIKSLHSSANGFKKSGNFIPYLGFSFDGVYIKFRDKTLTKFFYKIYRKIDAMVLREHLRLLKNKKRKSKLDKHWILKELKQGNDESKKFIDYVNRAKRVFPDEKYIKSFKDMVIKRIFIRFNKFSRTEIKK